MALRDSFVVPSFNVNVIPAGSTIPTTLTGTVAETIIHTIHFAAGSMGNTGLVRLSMWLHANISANAKACRCRVGAAGSGLAGVDLWNNGFNLNAHGDYVHTFTYWFPTTTPGQETAIAAGLSGAGGVIPIIATGAITALDTTQPWEINITGQLAVPGEAIVLNWILAEAIKI